MNNYSNYIDNLTDWSILYNFSFVLKHGTITLILGKDTSKDILEIIKSDNDQVKRHIWCIDMTHFPIYEVKDAQFKGFSLLNIILLPPTIKQAPLSAPSGPPEIPQST